MTAPAVTSAFFAPGAGSDRGLRISQGPVQDKRLRGGRPRLKQGREVRRVPCRRVVMIEGCTAAKPSASLAGLVLSRCWGGGVCRCGRSLLPTGREGDPGPRVGPAAPVSPAPPGGRGWGPVPVGR